MKDNSKDMRQLYEQWLTSNISKALFCRQQKIHYTTFHYWVKKFRNEDQANPGFPQDNGFSRISVTEPEHLNPNPLPFTVLTYPSGFRLEFFSAVEASYLKKLLS